MGLGELQMKDKEWRQQVAEKGNQHRSRLGQI